MGKEDILELIVTFLKSHSNSLSALMGLWTLGVVTHRRLWLAVE